MDKAPTQDVDLFRRAQAYCTLRNRAVHKLVKVSEHHKTEWGERVADFIVVAKEGREPTVEVNNWSGRRLKLY